MTRFLTLLAAALVAAFIVSSVLAAAFGLDPGPMPCGTEECG